MVGKNLKRKNFPVKKDAPIKRVKVRYAVGYTIVLGKNRDVKVKGLSIFRSKSSAGRKIFKSKDLALKFLRDYLSAANNYTKIKVRLQSPRVNKILIKDPSLIKRFKAAKEYIVR